MQDPSRPPVEISYVTRCYTERSQEKVTPRDSESERFFPVPTTQFDSEHERLHKDAHHRH